MKINIPGNTIYIFLWYIIFLWYFILCGILELNKVDGKYNWYLPKNGKKCHPSNKNGCPRFNAFFRRDNYFYVIITDEIVDQKKQKQLRMAHSRYNLFDAHLQMGLSLRKLSSQPIFTYPWKGHCC